jgi:hypothetical protein
MVPIVADHNAVLRPMQITGPDGCWSCSAPWTTLWPLADSR